VFCVLLHRILEKVAMCGAPFMPMLLQDTTMESIPECIGGTFKLFNEPYPFDLSVDGPLYCPCAPTGPQLSNSAAAGTTANRNAQSTLTASAAAAKKSGAAALFPEADKSVNSATLDSLLAPCASASVGTGTGASRTRSSSGSVALERVCPSRRAVTVDRLSRGVLKHAVALARAQPQRVVLTLLWAALFVYVRSTGWLQLLVYPIIVYATIFDTKAIVRTILAHFDIDHPAAVHGKARGG
jgi:hypothetical protein